MVRIALIQSNPQPQQLSQNLAATWEALAWAAQSHAQIAVLPEVWPRVFLDPLEDNQATDQWNQVLNQWQDHCRKNQIASVGSLPMAANGNYYNRAYFIDHEGNILAHYDKIHLFSLADEHKRYHAGTQTCVVAYAGFNFGLAICYDLRFPELYRALRAKGADAFITMAQWPSSRADHWSLLLRARAIENLAYHIGVNRVGHFRQGDKEIAYGGGSAVINPWGEPHFVAGPQVQIGYVILEHTQVERYRQEFPAWSDRHAFS